MLNIFFVLIIILIISIFIYFFLKKKILLIIQLLAKILNFGDYFFSFKLLSKNLTISQQTYINKKKF